MVYNSTLDIHKKVWPKRIWLSPVPPFLYIGKHTWKKENISFSMWMGWRIRLYFETLFLHSLLPGMSKMKIKLGTLMQRLLTDLVGVQERGSWNLIPSSTRNPVTSSAKPPIWVEVTVCTQHLLWDPRSPVRMEGARWTIVLWWVIVLLLERKDAQYLDLEDSWVIFGKPETLAKYPFPALYMLLFVWQAHQGYGCQSISGTWKL